jgi:ATP-dependent RNA helicase DDX55/SPB4
MGREGAAVIYLAPHESAYVEFLEVRHIKVKPFDPPAEPNRAAGRTTGTGGVRDTESNDREGGHEGEPEEDEPEPEESEEEGPEDDGEAPETESESESEAELDSASESESEGEGEGDEIARSGAEALNALLRKRSEANREAMEKGTRAFVSYMRGYKEHHCRFIFRHKELRLTRLASAMGLLRLPRMKEIRKAPKKMLAGFRESEVDPDSVPYAEKAREKQRRAANAEALKMRKEAEASGAAEEKSGKGAREKKKREDALKDAERLRNEKRLTASKRRQQEAREDLDDMNDDYRALKKLKKGKISEEEFDFELGFEQPIGGGRDGREYRKDTNDARSVQTKMHHEASRLHGAALKAAEKKPRPNKPRHLKRSKAKGGGKGAKALKKKKFNK